MFLEKYALCDFNNFQSLHERTHDKAAICQFSKYHSKLNYRVILNIKSLSFEPGSNQIESYLSYT